jgi:tetratricopeptide (TPR) repeat protein
VARRHAEFFVHLAERAAPALRGPNQLEWLDRLDQEHSNVRSAMTWGLEHDELDISLRLSGALWRYWEARGSIAEAGELLDRALVESRSLRSLTRSRALFARGRIALRQGNYEHACAVFAQARALSERLADEEGTALSVAGLGWATLMIGHISKAVKLSRDGLAVARRCGERWVIADALNNLGGALRLEGNLQGAKAAHEEALALREEEGDLEGITASLCSLAWVAASEEDYKSAQYFFEKGLAASAERHDIWYSAASNVVLGYAAFGRGDLVRARELCLRGLRSCGELGYPQYATVALETLAGVTAAGGAASSAARLWGAALSAAKNFGGEPMKDAAVERALAGARRDLGPRQWEQRVREGQALVLDDALAILNAEGTVSTTTAA